MSDDARPASAPAREEVILPGAGWVDFRWRELWNYRDLLWLSVRRDFLSRYKQSVLGPLWFIIQPLTTTILFSLIFGRFGRLPTDGVPGPVFYMGGQVLWGYFAGCLGATSNVLAGNSQIFSKVYFPRLIVPLASVASQALQMGLAFLVFVVLYAALAWHRAGIGAEGAAAALAVFPLLALYTAAAALGAGLILSALTAKYRDFQHMVAFLIQSLMFVTPGVIYPLSSVPAGWRGVVALNPMTFAVEGFKAMWFGLPFPSLGVAVAGTLVTGFLLAAGLVAFNRVQQTFIDTV